MLLRRDLYADTVDDLDYMIADMLFDAMLRADRSVLGPKLPERMQYQRHVTKEGYVKRAEQEGAKA